MFEKTPRTALQYKTCKKCEVRKSTEFFAKAKSNKDGFNTTCKKCKAKAEIKIPKGCCDKLVQSLRKNHNYTLKDSNIIVNAFFSTIKELMLNGEELEISNFGIFTTRLNQVKSFNKHLERYRIPIVKFKKPRNGRTFFDG